MRHLQAYSAILFIKVNTWNANHEMVTVLILRWKMAHPWLDSNPRSPDYICSNQLREWDIFQLRICDTGSGDVDFFCKHTNADHAQPTAPIFDGWRVVFETIEIVSFGTARMKSCGRRLGYTVNTFFSWNWGIYFLSAQWRYITRSIFYTARGDHTPRRASFCQVNTALSCQVSENKTENKMFSMYVENLKKRDKCLQLSYVLWC